jgi:hypothetical protein
MSTTNPLDLAREIGNQIMGDIGAQAFEELELAYASRLQPRFIEIPEMRPWQNICFYWKKSYLKNTLMEHFRNVLPDTFPNRPMQSTTTEKIFGSMREDKTDIIRPLFYKQNMVFIEELTAFLGEGETLRERMNNMNEALEGHRVTRDLLKFGNASQDLIDKYSGGIDGLYFNGETLWYYPETCFCACTRPVHPKTYATLEGSGFWSRFHVIQCIFTDAMARDLFTGSMRATGESSPVNSMKQELKLFNTRLMRESTSFPRNIPDDELLLPILQEATKIATRYGEDLSLDLADVTTMRVKGDIVREVNACRILNPQASRFEITSWAISRLEHFFSFIVKPQFDLTLEQKKQRAFRKDDCEQAILTAFKGQKGAEREAIKNEMQRLSFSIPTMDRALRTLTESGKIQKSERGKYDVP